MRLARYKFIWIGVIHPPVWAESRGVHHCLEAYEIAVDSPVLKEVGFK